MTICIIQARMGSTRLPGKVLMDLCGQSMLWHVVTRVMRSRTVDRVIVATSTALSDNVVAEFCDMNGFTCVRGSENDVLGRYHQAATEFGPADSIVRVTADCPLIDPKTIDVCVEALLSGASDYISNVVPGERTFPRGLDTEVFSFMALDRAFVRATEPYEREHVTPYIWQNKYQENDIAPMITAPPELARAYRLTVDYPEDFALIEKVYDALYVSGDIIDARQAVSFLDAHSEVASLNADCEQKPLTA